MKFVFLDEGFTKGPEVDAAWRTASVLILWSSIGGRLLIGGLADRFSKKAVMTSTYFVVAATIPLLLLVRPSSEMFLYAFAVMFGFGMGLGEDPGTGAAAAALIGELATDAGDGQTEYALRQGVEMGRPSHITLQIRKSGDALVHGGIGGDAVIVGRGTLDLDD